MQWYCIVFNPNCWRKVELQLAQDGLRSFLPKTRRWASHARTKTAKEYPLLGRYMFVECAQEDFWRVRSTHGVECFVDVAGDPVAFPGRWVTDFLQRYLSGEWDAVAGNPIPVGARVRIMEGEWQDMLGTVTGRKNGKVVVYPLGTKTPISTHASNVRAA